MSFCIEWHPSKLVLVMLVFKQFSFIRSICRSFYSLISSQPHPSSLPEISKPTGYYHFYELVLQNTSNLSYPPASQVSKEVANFISRKKHPSTSTVCQRWRHDGSFVSHLSQNLENLAIQVHIPVEEKIFLSSCYVRICSLLVILF